MKELLLVISILFVVKVGLAQKNSLWSADKYNESSVLYNKEKLSGLISNDESYYVEYRPFKANGVGVVVCPGGGYANVAIDLEGTKVAELLTKQGYTVWVLKYRLPYGRSHVPLSDVQQALRLMRVKAFVLDIDADKIGVMGFSAGGHLASTSSTHFDDPVFDGDSQTAQVSCRPAFSILIYPVISMEESITHRGSRKNLLGLHPTDVQIKAFSNDLSIGEDTPPTFILHADDDRVVSSLNSIAYYRRLKVVGISSEMHIFPKGGHGFGTKQRGLSVDHWMDLLVRWLDDHVIG
ncbi:alpha/beta hydrolase [Prolixibacteraceae bacterium]|nr:alpha/beta hydrolase [Prolixibacteraceae bacterium]